MRALKRPGCLNSATEAGSLFSADNHSWCSILDLGNREGRAKVRMFESALMQDDVRAPYPHQGDVGEACEKVRRRRPQSVALGEQVKPQTQMAFSESERRSGMEPAAFGSLNIVS